VLLARILTVSDGVFIGSREDRGGPALRALLEEAGFSIDRHDVASDGVDEVADALRALTEGFAGLIVSTGGTGFSPRDLTPEATRTVIQREAPGLAEAMRLVNPAGRLSRGVAGIVGQAIVINVPGSVGGATECLSAVIDVIPHALDLLVGGNPH